MNNHSDNSTKGRTPVVQAIHTAVKGRARYKIDGLHRSEALKTYLEFRLLDLGGIRQVSANPLTGNILVIFTSACSPSDLAGLIKKIVLEYGKQSRKNRRETDTYLATNRQTSKHLPISLQKVSKLIPPVREQKMKSWHLIEPNAVIEEFKTSTRSGLSSQTAEENLKKYGSNVLPEAVPRSGWSIFIEQFKSMPVALLTVAAVCSIATGGVVDALVIMGVVVINAVIGYATESQSEKIIHSLKSMVSPSALVMRESRLQEISAQEIVLGDILVLKPGSYVTADARLIEAKRLSIDESALTGESMPVAKTTLALTQENVPLGDRTNMVYMGTLVTGGQGLAVVVATGKYTEMGKIQSLVGEAELPETPMQKQLDQAGNQLVLISSAVCTVVFGIGLLRGYGWLEMLKTSISLAVAAVPEGLPAVATTTLAIGIAQMRQHHVLIRRLDAVETLGSVQTICMDKTGTITANKMSVVEIHSDTTRLKVVEGQLKAGEELVNPYTRDELLKLIHVLALCNESEVNGNGNGKGSEYVVRGSSTENALIDLALASGVDVNGLREKYPLQKIEHRSETCNYMTTFHTTSDNQELIAVKGNPTEVLELCGWYIKDGKTLPLTDAEKLAIEIENERMAGNGLRVLGSAYRLDESLNGAKTKRRKTTKKNSTSSAKTNGRQRLIWLGLVGMADPIRKGVKDLMGSFHQAGINTVMITGDQSPTAYAIGKELNLSQNQPLEILDSTRLSNIDPEVMKTLCDRIHVYARISPAHKLQIVQSLQREGKVVAMTGDGINDAPALKAADVGVAMGHTGTDVAREVGDVVLENDNLETMIIAVSQGRTIYNNIRKSVHFLLATNLSEIVVMLTATALGIGQPLNAMQLLWLNLVTDIFPGLALALEPPEPDVLSTPPRHPDEPIIQASRFRRIVLESVTISASALGAYGYGIMQYGIGQQASTIGFMSLTMAQLLHGFSCRSEKHSMFGSQQLQPNQYLNFAIAGSLGLQLLAAAPPLRGLLQLAPLNLVDTAVIGASALLPLLVNEGTKELWAIQLQQDDQNPIPQPPDGKGEDQQTLPTSVFTEGKDQASLVHSVAELKQGENV